MFLAESRERSSRDGMTYGSLIDYESQEIKKTELSTTAAEAVLLHVVVHVSFSVIVDGHIG